MSAPKKKVIKRSSSPVGGNSSAKKKRPLTPQTSFCVDAVEGAGDSNTSSPAVPEENKPSHIFKDPNFVHSTIGAAGGRKTRIWKNLKQIIQADRSLPWKPEDAIYGTIEAPPSFIPAKKYSDLTGLHAKYTDPHTKIRYSTPDEFARIQMLRSDIVARYLNLRKQNTIVP